MLDRARVRNSGNTNAGGPGAQTGRYPSAVARVCSPLQRERGPKARRLYEARRQIVLRCFSGVDGATGLKSRLLEKPEAHRIRPQ